MDFKIGDIVQLKSGGPKMTVVNPKDGSIFTTWFAGSKKETGSFPAEGLIKVENEKK